MGKACKHIVCIHASLCALVKLCAQRSPACSLDSIDTLISLIWPNLAEIWASAQKYIGCMHTRLHAGVKLCAQRGLAFSPGSIDILISLIWPNLAEIWAQAPKQIACMHTSLHACTLCVCVHRPISQPNLVGSERSNYLWNQENMMDLSEHISTQACMHAYYVLACTGIYFSQTLSAQKDEGIYGIGKNMPELCEHIWLKHAR